MSLAASIPQREGSQRFKNWYIGEKGIPHSFHRLSGEKGETIFRAIPEFQNGQELPMRLKAGDNELTSFVCIEQGVSFLGLGERFACLTRVKGATPGSYEQTGPVEKFVRTMTKAIKDTPQLFAQAGFADWIGWKANRGALTRVEDYGFVQGALFANGKTKYLSADQKSYKPLCPIVMQLGQSAWQAMLGLANTEVQGYAGHPEDWNNRYVSGDMISCAGGKLMHFTYHPPTNTTFPAYTVALGQAVPFDPRLVAGWWRPWDQVLHFLTAAEQFVLLLNHFPSASLDYVFAGTPYHQYLPDSEKGSWQRALMPRQYMPGQAGGAPGQQFVQAPPGGVQMSPGQPFGPPGGQMAPAAPAPSYPAPAAPAPLYTPPTQPAPTFQPAPTIGGMGIDLTGGAGAGDESRPFGAQQPVPGPGPSVQMGGPQPAFPAFPVMSAPAAPAAPTVPVVPQSVLQAPQPQYSAPGAMPYVQPAAPMQYAPPGPPPAGVPPLTPPVSGAPVTAMSAMDEARARLMQARPAQPPQQ